MSLETFLKRCANLPNSMGYRLRKYLARHLYPLPLVRLEALLPPAAFAEGVPTPILDEICLPPFHGTRDHDDFTPLLRVVREMQPATVVELGTAYGNTVANICRLCERTTVYTVNAPVEIQTGGVTTYDLSADEIGKVYRQHGFENRVVQIFENTLNLDLGKYVDQSSVDLAIVDACHDEEFVFSDFHKVAPFVRAGGIVFLHDTDRSMEQHLAGSYFACTRLRRDGYDIRQLADTWWGVWRKS